MPCITYLVTLGWPLFKPHVYARQAEWYAVVVSGCVSLCESTRLINKLGAVAIGISMRAGGGVHMSL